MDKDKELWAEISAEHRIRKIAEEEQERLNRVKSTQLRNVILIVSVLVTSIALLATLGVILNPRELARAEEVNKEISALRTSNKSDHDYIWKTMGETQQEIKSLRLESRESQKALEQRLESIDNKLWRITTDLKGQR